MSAPRPNRSVIWALLRSEWERSDRPSAAALLGQLGELSGAAAVHWLRVDATPTEWRRAGTTPDEQRPYEALVGSSADPLGRLMLFPADTGARDLEPATAALTAETATALTLITVRARLLVHQREVAEHTATAAQHRREVQARITHVRDAESRRLVTELRRSTAAALQPVRAAADDIERALAGADADSSNAATFLALTQLDGALARAVDEFRAVARGLHPMLLRDQGVLPALRALTHSLPVPVTISGDLGRRSQWQAESTLYHAAAAVLRSLAHRLDSPIELHALRSDAILRIGLSQVDGRTGLAAGIRHELAADIERLTVLGGEAVIESTAGRIVVEIWLHESL